MKATFGLACGDAGYNSRDDFNNNCIVSISDSSLLNQNFGRVGTNCTTCGCPAQVWKPDLGLGKPDPEKIKKWTTMAIPVTEKISKTDLDSK